MRDVISIRIGDDLRSELESIAHKKKQETGFNYSLAALIRKAVEDYILNEKKNEATRMGIKFDKYA